MRLVSLDGERGTFECEVRTVSNGGMQPGDLVWVEFGGFLAERSGRRVRYAGQWQPCVVEPSSDDTLCVRLVIRRRPLAPARPNGLPDRRKRGVVCPLCRHAKGWRLRAEPSTSHSAQIRVDLRCHGCDHRWYELAE
jgi:hypothetical protein